MSAQVVRTGLMDMQVCVPKDWSDEQAEQFANGSRPTGLDHGWKLREAADRAQNGAPIRVQCEQDAANVHIMLSC
jgi:hypothetical protein